MSLLNDLQWRYATKKMNGKKVPQDKLDYILVESFESAKTDGKKSNQTIIYTDESETY